MTPVRHILIGEWPKQKNLCDAPRKSLPEKYLATEQYLHEIKGCPTCNALGAQMDPPRHIRGFDELPKQQPVVRQQPVMGPAISHTNAGLFLRDYLTGRND